MKPNEVVMGNFKSITVNVGDHDEQLALERKAVREVVEGLKKRIFFSRMQGNQRHYYDVETGTSNLTLEHIIPMVIDSMPAGYEPGNVYSSNNDLCQLIKNTNFLPIVKEPQYYPGLEAPVVKLNGLYFPNSWRKPTCVPKAFSSIEEARSNDGAAPLIEHLQLMLSDEFMDLDHPESKAGYVIRMLAYRYQIHDFRRGQKPHVAFYFWGKQGYGKSLFANMLNTVFGESAVRTVSNESALTSGSQVDIFTCTWAVVDETHIKKGSVDYNTIKSNTGQTFIESSRKHEHFKKWYIPAQLIMFGQKEPTFIEPGDRRFFVNRWDTEFESQAAKDDYFEGYTNWLYNEDGFAAIAGLLAVTDISNVRIESPPLMTDDKKMVINMVTDYSVSDIKEIINQHPERICFVASDFEEVWEKYDIKRNQFVYKLAEAGLSDTNKHKYDGLRRRFFVRNSYRLPRSQGSKLRLEHKVDPTKTIYLTDDPGYISASEMSRGTSHDGDFGTHLDLMRR